MNTLFPFGFPWPTVLYLVLYVVTLVIHVAFMNYVLAGSGYIALVRLFGGDKRGSSGPMVTTLRDWTPFMLSAAITAGVAPLLFIQILYQHNFYTANLLGYHRWMAILPILIVAFYMLYLLKAKWMGRWSTVLRAGIGLAAFACFAFVAYSWTENYLLSVAGRETWAREYVSESLFYAEVQLVPRLAVWFLGALPTMVLLVSWQLWYAQRVDRPEIAGEARRCGTLALAGLAATAIAGLVYFAVDDSPLRSAFFNWLAGPYIALAVVGFCVQAVAWSRQRQAPVFEGRWLSLASAGALLTLLGMTVAREAIRLTAIDITSLYDQHAAAAEKGGIEVFLLFFVGNIVAIAWCFRLVRSGLVAPTDS